MSKNPYQAEALEPLLNARRWRRPNAFQRTFSALFLFLGSSVAVIAAVAAVYDLTRDGALGYLTAARREASIAAMAIGVGFVAAGFWIRRSPR